MDRKIANDRVSVVSKRVPPLVAVFSVAPAALVITHVCDGAGFECLRGPCFCSLRCTFGLTEVDRVLAIAYQLAATLGLFAGLSQADIVQATKPHSAFLAVPFEAKQPAFVYPVVFADRHLQVQPEPIIVQAGFLQTLHPQCRQSQGFCHGPVLTLLLPVKQ